MPNPMEATGNHRNRFDPVPTGKIIEPTESDAAHFFLHFDRYQILDTNTFILVSEKSEDWKRIRLKEFFHEKDDRGQRYLVRKRLPADRPRLLSQTPDLHHNTPAATAFLNTVLPDRPLPYVISPQGTHLRALAYEALFLAHFVELGVKKTDVRFIPPWEIIGHAKCPQSTRNAPDPFAIPLPPSRSIAGKQRHSRPDNIFGLEYLKPDGTKTYRFCKVEVDGGTETTRAKKSKPHAYIEQKLLDDIAIYDNGIYRSHFGIPNMLSLYITTSERRMRNFQALAQEVAPKANQFLFNYFRYKRAGDLLPMPTADYFGPWWTSKGAAFDLSKI